MNRRSVLKSLGATTLAGSAVLGSGALTQVTAKRNVEISVTTDRNSAVRLEAGNAASNTGGGFATISANSNGELTFSTVDINQDGQLLIGQATSNDPNSNTISDYAFTIADNTNNLGSNTALGIDVSISSPTDTESGLGMVFLPTDTKDDLLNTNATGGKGYDSSDTVAGTGLAAGGNALPSLPSRYEKNGNPDNDSARFLLDEAYTVGAEMLIQADAADANGTAGDTDVSFTVTITAETVDTSTA